jgi:dolichol-phosphate mannosyltransferase
MTDFRNEVPAVRAKLLSVVVPIYNDEECVRPFLERVKPILGEIRSRFSFDHEIIFVMDPGTDGTERIILEARRNDPSVKLITLSRRFGQQPAILAGIFSCHGECCIIIDADMQDPPELMLEMMSRHAEGRFNVVYAERKGRRGEPWTKRAVTFLGYWLMNKLSSIQIPRNVGDFRLIDRRVIEELRGLNERHAFFRGLVPFVGFRQTGVSFVRLPRHRGTTKYNYWIGSVTNGVNALVCFSNKLLNLSILIGFGLFFLSVALSLLVAYLKLFTTVPIASGIATVIILIIFTSGVQALLIGILGAYIGRIYDETKQRPIYIVDQKVGL